MTELINKAIIEFRNKGIKFTVFTERHEIFAGTNFREFCGCSIDDSGCEYNKEVKKTDICKFRRSHVLERKFPEIHENLFPVVKSEI